MRAYLGAIFGKWVRMWVGPLSGGLGLVSDLTGGLRVDIPLGPYRLNLWLTIAVVALFVAQALVYRDMFRSYKRQTDKLLSELQAAQTELDSRIYKQEVLNQFAEFLMKADGIQAEIENDAKNLDAGNSGTSVWVPWVDSWATEVEAWLTEHPRLGASYLQQFTTVSGTPIARTVPIANMLSLQKHRKVWAALEARKQELRKIVEEIRRDW